MWRSVVGQAADEFLARGGADSIWVAAGEPVGDFFANRCMRGVVDVEPPTTVVSGEPPLPP